MENKNLQRNEERRKYPAEHLGGQKNSCPPVCWKKKIVDQKSPPPHPPIKG